MAKFNGKSIAVGIGIGLIIASVLNIREASKPLSLEALEEQAQKYYGKVLVSEGSQNPVITPTPEPTTSPTKEPSKSPTKSTTLAPTETPTVAPTEKPTVAPTAKPTTAPTATPTIKPTTTPIPSVVKTFSVSFTVTDNTSSETVANWLAKGGLVNKDQFLGELNRRGLATKIRNGRYTFEKGMTMNQIIKALTGR